MEEKGVMEAFYRLTVKDKEGEVVLDTGEQRSHSFVLQFLQAVYAFTSNTTLATVKLIDGTAGGWDGAHYISLNGAADDPYEGICVGTGLAAESNIDFKLATLIAQGVAAGQLDYGTQDFAEAIVVGANVDYVLTRTIVNGSGGAITINEIGIHMQPTVSTGIGTAYLMIRDLLGAGVAVAHAETLTVQYTFRTTV